MKLELKHLAPYLPYGLKLRKQSPNHEENTVDLTPLRLHYFNNDNYPEKGYFLKPILRPLSDLANEIEINGSSFYPLESLLVQKYPKWFSDNNGDSKYTHITIDFSGRFATAFFTYQATLEIQIDSTYINNTSYLVFQKLFEWHFDVFGLINKELAIDINTLES